MISADELKRWLAGLRGDDLVGMEEGLDSLYRGRQRLDRDRRSAEGGRMKSLGFQTYLPGGQSAASHIHRLVRIDEAPYRYRRVHCGARLAAVRPLAM